MPTNSWNSNPLDLLRRIGADARLRSGEFDALFDVLPMGIGVATDRECRHIRVNRAFAEQLGIRPHDNASLSAPDEERPAFRVERDGIEVPAEDLPMQHAARTGEEVTACELDVIHPDGRRVSLFECAVPLFDEDGNVAGSVGIVVDITERRRTEQEQRFLAEASRVLTSSLDYDATLRTLSELAVPMLGDYCAVDVTRDDGTFERVTLVTGDHGKQQVAEALRRYPPRLTVDSPAARAILSGETIVFDDCPPDVIARSAQSDDHRMLLEEFGARSFMMLPLRARGRTLGLLTVGGWSPRRYDARDKRLGADVAARAALALDNALLYRHAQDANRVKDDFLATLSHELRTPLNALLGWTLVLKTHGLDDAARRRALESIERNAHAQAVLINDLLDVSRVITGKLRVEVAPLDLSAVVLAAVDAVRPALRARDIQLGLALTAEGVQVLGDRDRLQQVIWNLLSNAVKFTPRSGRVDVSVEDARGAVHIVVRDTGIGIDPAFLPHVFERFRQGDSSTTRAQGGLGLGLAIVRHLVDLHGGTVSVKSDGVGLGATFTVTLPAYRADAAPPEREAPSPSEERPRLTGVRVLAVDDDEDARELVLLAVRASGAEVMVVASAEAAIDAVTTFDPHVLVTDIAMPDMDGYTLVSELHARHGARAPVAVALSAYLTSDDLERSRAAGFVQHLGKPVDFERLVDVIAQVAAPRLASY
ncbi:MAG TPA: ATP-binding protein [Vicinamibacterales bacterium]